MRICLVWMVIVLAGCMTPTERAARAEQEMNEMIQVYGPACERLGYKRDTDPWRDCVVRMGQREDARANRGPFFSTCFGNGGFLYCQGY